MKKYVVIRKNSISAGIEREFNHKEDATQFKNLMQRSEQGTWKYYVAEVLL